MDVTLTITSITTAFTHLLELTVHYVIDTVHSLPVLQSGI
jgi:hypothetical protein